MSKSGRTGKMDKKMQENIAQFCGVTGASVKEGQQFLEKYKRVDVAMDAYYNDPSALSSTPRQTSSGSTSKLNALFDRYKDPDTPDEISIDGTIKMCEDLEVDPEDVVLLALAYELKSLSMGQWTKASWVDGWRSLGCDTIATMKSSLPRLRQELASDPAYFKKVYAHTFEFAKADGARSIALDTAQAFWELLLPHGLEGGALSHTVLDGADSDDDVSMQDANEEGWRIEYNEWWFQFLKEKGVKGISKDTWNMFLDFVRTIDAKFEKYDLEAAWPSTIDDFVEWAKAKLQQES